MQLGKIYDIIIHGINFSCREAQHSSIHIDIFSTRQFWVKAHSKLNKRHQFPIDGDGAFFWHIDFRNNFQESRFSRTISSEDPEKVSFFYFKRNILKHMLFFIAFDSFEAIDQGSSKTIGRLCWQLKVLADMVYFYCNLFICH